MSGIILAWLVGEGIITYRVVTQDHHPPLPSQILASSGFFVIAGIIAEANNTLGTLLAVGVDAAAALSLFRARAAAKAAQASAPPLPARTVIA